MDAITAKREVMLHDFLSGWFILGSLVSSDTYKRTMWSADENLSRMKAAYHLTFRKSLPETNADNRLIMAGHEWLLRQWFLKPFKRQDIEIAIQWYTQHSAIRAFPVKTFKGLLEGETADAIYLPIDIWGFPGGQTFFAKVPCMSFEGIGGIVSFIEPHMCRYFGPVIQATKGRLMFEAAGERHAEFGYRSDPNDLMSIAKLLSIYIGNDGNRLRTSCDVAEFIFPDLFEAIGTIGHEFMSSLQDFSKGLDQAELEAMDVFVSNLESASLLCDLVDAETVGLENAIRIMKKYPGNDNIGIRVDSGDLAAQCVQYYNRMVNEGIKNRLIVFEDEVTPDKVREVYSFFQEKTGMEPVVLFPGAGGYYYRLFHRDTVSAAFKRSMTEDRPNTKFSNSPGKESVPGRVRVYEQGNRIIVAAAEEKIDGIPLFVKLVENGRIIYSEDMDFPTQARRAGQTWDKYKGFEYSPRIYEWRNKFRVMRDQARQRAGDH